MKNRRIRLPPRFRRRADVAVAHQIQAILDEHDIRPAIAIEIADGRAVKWVRSKTVGPRPAFLPVRFGQRASVFIPRIAAALLQQQIRPAVSVDIPEDRIEIKRIRDQR